MDVNGTGGAWRTISVALHADSGQYVTSLTSASTATKAFGVETDKVTAKSGASWTSFSKIAKVGLAAAGIALVAFIGMSIKAAAEFDSKMSAVRAVAGATGDEFDKLRAKALQIGADTSFSASQAATAMEELAKAGVNTTGILNGAADATVALAAAGGVDLAQAAEIAANAMNQYGLTAADLPRIADLVAGSANRSAIGVEDFGMSLSQAGAVAKLIGVDFNDTAVAITAMGNAGIKGSDAGTSLKTFLMRLAPQTAEAADEMERLGIITEDGANRFFDAQGNLQSMSKVSGILKDSLKGLNREQQITALTTVFGSDAIRAAAVVAEEGSAGWDKLTESIGNVSAQDVAEERLNNVAGSVEKLKGSIETMLISSGSLFTAVLKPVVDGATELVNLIAQDPTEFFQAIGRGLAPLAPAWDDVVKAGDNLLDLLGELWDVAEPVAVGLAKIGGAAVIVGLKTLASLIEATTGFLADHRELVIAVGMAYAGWKIAGIVSGISAALDIMAIKAYEATGALMSSAAVGNLKLIGTGIANVVTNLGAVPDAGTRMASGLSTGIGQVKQGLSGLTAGISGVTLGFAAAAVAVGAIFQGIAKAHEQAKSDIADLKPEGPDVQSIDALLDYQEALGRGYEAALKNKQGTDGFLMSLKGAAELLSPMENQVLDNAVAANDYEKAYDIAKDATNRFIEGVGRSARVLGLSTPVVEQWIAKLKINPGEIGWKETRKRIEEASNAAKNGTPQTDSLAEAYATLADETSTSTEKLDAWKSSLDAALGIPMDIFDAETGLASNLRDLTMALATNGAGISANTKEATDNREALSGAAQSVIDLATAYGQGEGGIEAANLKLAEGREKLLAAGEAAGISREEMSGYLDELGLTPEFVKSQIQLGNVKGAKRELDEVTGKLNGIDGKTAKAKVQVDVQMSPALLTLFAEQQASTDQGSGSMWVVPPSQHKHPGSPGWNNANRWGNVYAYARGGFGAGIYNGPIHKFAEPETGGEAYFPRLGDLARNEKMMGYVAKNWYGGAFIPAGHMPQAMPRMPMNAAYSGLDASGIASILAGAGAPNVTVNARTDANPRQIATYVGRAVQFPKAGRP